MYFRKSKRNMRNRTYRRKAKRKLMIPRNRMKYNNSFVNIKRTAWLESWTLSTASTTGFWRYYSFAISQLPSSTEFTNLYDTYRIRAAKLTFRPRFDGFGGENTTDTTLPGITNQHGNLVHTIIDPYSTVSPSGTYTTANLNSFLENGNVRTHQGNKAFSVYVSRPAIDRYTGGVSTGARVRSPWMQTSAANQTHNGVHVFLQDFNMTGVSGQSFDVFVTLYMQFKNLK